ncbi:rhodanese-like domain-containing protein [Glaciecola sp. XM2]|jgi:rhodanese-related sulfurtransferase|uniref:rhodanese-like domain-containing protein n=1 Tax=Glaciecola sp. XM2 TaxID=1914931 RepID=UPI001BDDE69B|nr:rhodanese-like domain-containing protein [Glaciecola sp. XM2]MBT1449815.1 rhodanese-like domain-containing protein [Glaciecola sp. XM2]
MDHIIDFARDNVILSGIWLALVVMLVYSFIGPALSKVKRVDNHGATLLINKQDAVLLDIRAQKDFKAGHIVGARQIKPEEVREGNFSKLEKYKSTPIIVVCAMGNLAVGTASKMTKQGFSDVSVLSGGMNAWQSAGLPVEK